MLRLYTYKIRWIWEDVYRKNIVLALHFGLSCTQMPHSPVFIGRRTGYQMEIVLRTRLMHAHNPFPEQERVDQVMKGSLSASSLYCEN
jgi:hypothetical protein